MTNIETIARAVLDGAARGSEVETLARWVLERCEEDAEPEPERPVAYHPCGCIVGFLPCGHDWSRR